MRINPNVIQMSLTSRLKGYVGRKTEQVRERQEEKRRFNEELKETRKQAMREAMHERQESMKQEMKERARAQGKIEAQKMMRPGGKYLGGLIEYARKPLSPKQKAAMTSSGWGSSFGATRTIPKPPKPVDFSRDIFGTTPPTRNKMVDFTKAVTGPTMKKSPNLFGANPFVATPRSPRRHHRRKRR